MKTIKQWNADVDRRFKALFAPITRFFKRPGPAAVTAIITSVAVVAVLSFYALGALLFMAAVVLGLAAKS